MTSQFQARGLRAFPAEEAVLNWLRHATGPAYAVLNDPDHVAQWQCDGTWFVGLEALANDPVGRIDGGPSLAGRAVDFAASLCGTLPPLHRAQLSVIRPGYPKPRQGESDAGFRYRLNRDAAHVDGVLGLGQPKRRFLREPHGFLLGIPLNDASAQAAPLVVWEGSHEIMRKTFQDALKGHAPEHWADVDVTDAYVAARKHCFATCRRVVVHVPVGAAYVVHRLALHGVAPWREAATSATEGRMIAYLRPELPGGLPDWLDLP